MAQYNGQDTLEHDKAYEAHPIPAPPPGWGDTNHWRPQHMAQAVKGGELGKGQDAGKNGDPAQVITPIKGQETGKGGK